MQRGRNLAIRRRDRIERNKLRQRDRIARAYGKKRGCVQAHGQRFRRIRHQPAGHRFCQPRGADEQGVCKPGARQCRVDLGVGAGIGHMRLWQAKSICHGQRLCHASPDQRTALYKSAKAGNGGTGQQCGPQRRQPRHLGGRVALQPAVDLLEQHRRLPTRGGGKRVEHLADLCNCLIFLYFTAVGRHRQQVRILQQCGGDIGRRQSTDHPQPTRGKGGRAVKRAGQIVRDQECLHGKTEVLHGRRL